MKLDPTRTWTDDLRQMILNFGPVISVMAGPSYSEMTGPVKSVLDTKHMITGYDHILFLVGVIFFLYKPKDILIYVSFFTIGHSLTLLLGVLGNISTNAYLIDAIIAFSIVYKGFDNLGGFRKIFGFQPNTKAAVLIFGLFHGFGLASKLQDFKFGKDGLITNLIGFNIGVEIGHSSLP